MADDLNQVTLVANGKILRGWLDVTITSVLTSLARGFQVALTRATDAAGNRFLEVRPGDDVTVSIGKDRVLTGFITAIETAYSSKEITIKLTGFSKTTNLDDCMLPPGTPKALKRLTYADGIKKIIAPFNLEVVDQSYSTDKTDFEISVSETVGSFLKKFLKKNALLLTDDEFGRLVIAAPGSAGNATDAIELSKNVLSAKRKQDIKKRFSKYYVLGQGTNPKSERTTAASSLFASAEDEDFQRKERVLVKTSSGNATMQVLQAQAYLQRDVGVGASDVVSYTLNGWRQSDGSLWRVNTIVVVEDPINEKKRQTFLISKVTYKLNASGGTTTEIELKNPRAYAMLAEPQKAKAKDSKGKIDGDKYKHLVKNSGQVGDTKWTKK